MDSEEKLRIANSGGSFDEENSGWIGKPVRKEELLGKIVRDQNGAQRILTIEFEDKTREDIVLNNIGIDDKSVHQYEWKSGDTWYKF